MSSDATHTGTDAGATDEAPAPTEDDVILEVSHAARAKVLEIRDAEDDPGSLALRVEVTGVNGDD
jgi:hypothetical protein